MPQMKTSLPLFAFSLLIFGFASCERHPWEDEVDAETGEVLRKGTKRLFETHGSDQSETTSEEGDKKAVQ